MAEALCSGPLRSSVKEKLNMTHQNNSKWYVRTLCAILFLVFSFLYLYHYQADVIAYTQHVCSGGQTQYHRVIGTVLIIVTAFIIQFGLGRVLNRLNLLYAWSYIPSLMAIIALTGIRVQDGVWTFGTLKYLLPLAIVAYALLSYWLLRICNIMKYMYRFSPATVVISNMSCMLISFSITLCAGNHDRSLHDRLRMERCVMEGEYGAALDVARHVSAMDNSVSMLTAYALSNKGELADRLFTYNMASGSSFLTPSGSGGRLLMMPSSAIYKALGFWPMQDMPASKYFDFLYRHHLGSKASFDYRLVSYLLDKRIDKFAASVQKAYDLGKPLPQHYREALVLYAHLRSNPVLIIHDDVMEADFQDFQKLMRTHASKAELRNKVRDVYGNTYWFYYFFK